MGDTTTAGGVWVQEKDPRDNGQFDWLSGQYIVQRRFHVGVDWIQALSLETRIAAGGGQTPDFIPRAWVQWHTDTWTGLLIPVNMELVTKSSERLKQHESILTCTYEGHVCLYPESAGTTTAGAGLVYDGVQETTLEIGNKSEPIIVSYDVDPVTLQRIGIGQGGEGTNRLAPTVRWVITQNVGFTAWENWIKAAVQYLTCKTNENNWRDFNGVLWPEAAWLYLGATERRNRDYTITLAHQLDWDSTGKFHQYGWFFTDSKMLSVGGKEKPIKVPVGGEQLSTIYEVAAPAPPVTYGFANLFTHP